MGDVCHIGRHFICMFVTWLTASWKKMNSTHHRAGVVANLFFPVVPVDSTSGSESTRENSVLSRSIEACLREKSDLGRRVFFGGAKTEKCSNSE